MIPNATLMPVVDLRPATDDDAALFYRLRNDPDARRFSDSPGPISPEDHLMWWYGAEEYRFVVGDHQGVVRVSPQGRVSIILDPGSRARGVGPAVLRAIGPTAGLPALDAVIHYDNIASQKAFLKAGWRPTRMEWRQEETG